MGIASWMNRQNVRIHGTTLRVPMEELLVERPHLRPLIPSLYAMAEHDFAVYEVKDMPYVRYKTNKYSVPRTHRFQNVKYKVVNDVIHIYDFNSGEKLVQHQIDSRKGVTITLPEHKKVESTAWRTVATSLKVKYWCPSMEHFINGVCKENPRYRFEQLQAVERFLDKHKPVDPKMLERVLGACCERLAYRVSEFEIVYHETAESTKDPQQQIFALETKPIQGVKVQQRGMESYARAFHRLANEQEGGHK